MTQTASTSAVKAGRVERLASGIYEGLWRVLAVWFDVPRDPPELPRTTPDGYHRAFKPAPGYLSYRKLVFWIVAILIDLALLVGWVAILIAEWWVGLLLFVPFLLISIVPDIFGYVAVHLGYDTAWYVMTDRSIRIRRGVWILHETTITFENVQNVSVKQGPLQRHFGIADVTIETAGAGSAQAGKHGSTTIGNQGRIEGIDNAEEIRDLILQRLRASKSAGLGDEAATPSADLRAPAFSAEHIRVLREIRGELAAMNV